MAKDNKTVSLAKAIGIILMVTGHAWCGSPWEHWVNHFHMPLFFFLSGYCFKESYLDECKTFIKRRIKNVWWPYAKWGVIFVLLHNIFLQMHIYDTFYGCWGKGEFYYNTSTIFSKCLESLRFNNTEFVVCGFWFLRSLFYGSLFFLLTRKFVKNQYIGTIVLLAITLLMSWKRIGITALTISSDDAFAATFIMCGNIFRKYDYSNIGRKYPFAIIIGSIILIELAYFLGVEYLMYCHVWWIIPCLITGIVGILGTITLCLLLQEKLPDMLQQSLIYIGNHTIEILTWHILCFKLFSYILVAMYGDVINRVGESPIIVEYANNGWWIVYAICGLYMPIGFCLLKDRIYGNRLFR